MHFNFPRFPTQVALSELLITKNFTKGDENVPARGDKVNSITLVQRVQKGEADRNAIRRISPSLNKCS